MRWRILYACSPQWAGLLMRAEELIAGDGFRLEKDIARNRAGLLDDPRTGCVFVKRFTAGSWLEGVFDRIRGSRASRSLRAAAALRAAGFRCPEPVAAGEQITLGAARRSWLISEALTQAQVFSVFLDRRRGGLRDRREWRREVLGEVARCVRRLHDVGLFTSDLQETNLMLAGEAGDLEIYFVDLDGFRQLTAVSWRRRRRNLVQLDRTVGRFLSRSERLHFLREYLAPGARPLRPLTAALMRERARKDSSNARKHARRAARGGAEIGSEPLSRSA
jgi:tRNA A-37 threonylcarbamoyl transferase component Bud32